MQYLALIQYSEKESVILMTHHICRSQNKLVSELPISGNYTTVLEVKCFRIRYHIFIVMFSDATYFKP